MADIILGVAVVLGLVLAASENACMLLAHGLNTLFRLPHPGPDDIQGTCWCRRHEGPNRHSFVDYVNNVLGRE